eukprot:7603662-Lingulodinium_polyedra.AAC.1
MRTRSICEPARMRTVDSTTSLSNVVQTLRNDAVESTARRRDGSPIARSRAPRAQQYLLRAWNAQTCNLRRRTV